MAGRLQIAALFVLLALAVTAIAAPIQDEKTETSENASATKTTETEVKPQKPAAVSEHEEEEETPQEPQEGSGAGSNTQAEEAVEEEEDNKNEEVTNYKTIETDEGSDVTNDNNVEPYPASVGDEMPEFRLTDEDAMELLRELSDPSQVALFILESDDVEGFLRSVQMLLDQGYITEGYAVFLKETVSEELEQLLIMRDEQYQESLDLQPVQPMDTEFVDEILNEGMPYIPEDYFENVDPYGDINAYPEVDYPLFQEPYSEETMALAEVANIIADQIESGRMSADRGERIITLLSQLIPESFWQDDEEEDEDDLSDEMMAGLDEALAAGLYPALPEDEGEGYQAYRTEEDEPLPGGARHTEEEVVVDEQGRPVADVVQTETEQRGTVGDEDEGGEELEKELMEMEPAISDDMEEALQDIDKLTVADGETDAEDEEQRMRDELNNSEWKDLVLLLDGGKLSDGFLEKLGLTSDDVQDLTEAEDEEDMKP